MRTLPRSTVLCVSAGAILSTLFALNPGELPPSTPPPPLDVPPTAFLAYGDEHFDPEAGLLMVPFGNPGYHSRVPDGTLVHPTRESLAYAVVLLDRGEPGDAERAMRILETVLPLQDDEPGSETFGVWPWLFEEPLAEMSSPDLNWADFCGAHLAQILHDHETDLPGDLVRDADAALARAAAAIRRRDVGPGYTNIAVLGGMVCAAAGERLGDTGMLVYGRERLAGVVEFTQKRGGFVEYNSPPYAQVVISACERTLHLVDDPATRRSAEWLRRRAWRMIAEHFHAGTQQWAGPHARTSRDRLRVSSTRFLSVRTGVRIEPHPTMTNEPPRELEVAPPLPCPAELVPRFVESPRVPFTRRSTFVRSPNAVNRRVGTTWMTVDACLGSVNRSSFWTQRKPVIGYWRTVEDAAVVFRVRFLADGADFASMGLRTQQHGARLRGSLESRTGLGRWHRSLDRPPDGRFRLHDLRLRLELLGVGVSVSELGSGRFELAAGGRRVVITTRPGTFAGESVRWKMGRDAERVFVDAICHTDGERTFDFDEPIEMSITFGAELERRPESVGSPVPSTDPERSHADEAEGGESAVRPR